jgi:hypothetical protein
VEDICRENDQKNGVCPYPMTEQELPEVMASFGFREVRTDYVAVNLTPDDPRNTREEAEAMLDAMMYTSLDAAKQLAVIAPDHVTGEEIVNGYAVYFVCFAIKGAELVNKEHRALRDRRLHGLCFDGDHTLTKELGNTILVGLRRKDK